MFVTASICESGITSKGGTRRRRILMADGATTPTVPMPEPFVTVRAHRLDIAPSVSAVCVGYEGGSWRSKQFADHVVEWLPEFALSPAEWQALNSGNAIALIRRASKTVYESGKFKNRGEFGELFLHLLIRQVFNSLPAISKIFYKTATNETVKGFDAVHVVGPANDMELWLGEAKFYPDVTRAIRDVVKELHVHLAANYLKSEFMLIKGKIDDDWPHSERLRRLLSPNTSLDEVFKRICIPVLLTYDSECLSKHKGTTDGYVKDFETEIKKHYASFVTALNRKDLPAEVRIHLFLMPLHSKKVLVAELDRKLKACQQI